MEKWYNQKRNFHQAVRQNDISSLTRILSDLSAEKLSDLLVEVCDKKETNYARVVNLILDYSHALDGKVIDAVVDGDTDALSQLKSEGIVLNTDLLFTSIKLQHYGITEILLDGDHQFHLPSQYDGNTVLFYAIKNIWPDIVALLLTKGACPNATCQYDQIVKMPMLTYAVKINSVSIVKLLLSHKADPNAADAHERPALYYTDELEMIGLLLGNGADSNANWKYGHDTFTLLKRAVRLNNEGMVKLMLSYGASYTTDTIYDASGLPNNDVLKLLLLSNSANSEELVSSVIENDVDKLESLKQGVFITNALLQVALILKHHQCTKLLLSLSNNHFDFRAKDVRSLFLQYALDNSWEDIFAMILSLGALSDNTLLHNACEHDRLVYLKLLLKFNDDHGLGVMVDSVVDDDAELLRELLEQGVTPNTDLLFTAVKLEYYDCAQLLLQYQHEFDLSNTYANNTIMYYSIMNEWVDVTDMISQINTGNFELKCSSQKHLMSQIGKNPEESYSLGIFMKHAAGLE